MINKTQTRRIIRRLRYVFPSVLVIVGLLALVGGLTKVFQQNANPNPSSSAPLPNPLSHQAYTSDKLGISFTYSAEISGVQRFFTREIGDTVYLYFNFNKGSFNKPFPGTNADFLTLIAPGALSVEVFNKNPQQSLTDAIKQQFLAGYPVSDCFVRATPYGHPRLDDTFQTAIIDFPHNKAQTREQLDATVAKCPKYVTAYGVSYFLMDPQHPNKLLFIKIGQSNIPSGVNGYTWDGTLKVY